MGIEVQRAPARFIITIGWIKADAGLEFLGATDGVECPVNRGARFARECFREFRFAFFFVEEAQHKLVFRISVEHPVTERPKIVTRPKHGRLLPVSDEIAVRRKLWHCSQGQHRFRLHALVSFFAAFFMPMRRGEFFLLRATS